MMIQYEMSILNPLLSVLQNEPIKNAFSCNDLQVDTWFGPHIKLWERGACGTYYIDFLFLLFYFPLIITTIDLKCKSVKVLLWLTYIWEYKYWKGWYEMDKLMKDKTKQCKGHWKEPTWERWELYFLDWHNLFDSRFFFCFLLKQASLKFLNPDFLFDLVAGSHMDL